MTRSFRLALLVAVAVVTLASGAVFAVTVATTTDSGPDQPTGTPGPAVTLSWPTPQAGVPSPPTSPRPTPGRPPGTPPASPQGSPEPTPSLTFRIPPPVASPSDDGAALIWHGVPAEGTDVFGNLNCDSPASVSTVDDSSHGRVWRYRKVSGSNRCENHGIAVEGTRYEFRNGSTYYLGWWSKLSSTVNNNATFQWKSYGDHIQNYPVVLKMIDGRMTMIQRQPDRVERQIWSAPISADTWHHYVVGLHLSDETTGGWVELWLDGEQQTFRDGSPRWACRTLDDINEPKWGIYGATDTSVDNYVADLKVGTTLASVVPAGRA